MALCRFETTVLTLNGHNYRLVSLDTNVVSEVLRDTGGARAGFLSLFADGAHIPCFTVYSLFELRRRVEIYDQFIELFDVLPCMLLKNEEMLFEDERAVYPEHERVDPTLLAFSLLNKKHGTNLKNLMEMSAQNPDTQRREREWPSLKQEILDAWIDLRPNFSPRGRRFTPFDGIDFVNRVTLQQVRERAPEWTSEMDAAGSRIAPTAFPSVRMTCWTIFFRLYLAHRKPEVQDVFDALIATPTPYVDAVVTENFQADIYGQVKRFEPRLKPIDVYTLRDLRSAADIA
jgi:hypothetical protein